MSAESSWSLLNFCYNLISLISGLALILLTGQSQGRSGPIAPSSTGIVYPSTATKTHTTLYVVLYYQRFQSRFGCIDESKCSKHSISLTTCERGVLSNPRIGFEKNTFCLPYWPREHYMNNTITSSRRTTYSR
ncbi:hypothetical protein K449DRAFT_273125 [Hypoxylon sp. EC38]|nr:hypothetical protein K449DRAFT_273125 [Hypoxylon sp. EC38]